MTPVEMLGYTEFPRIGREPYRLTLAPYGFFWFELQGQPEPVESRGTRRTRRRPDGLLVGDDWETLFAADNRAVLESGALPEFLPETAMVRRQGAAASRRHASWTGPGCPQAAIALCAGAGRGVLRGGRPGYVLRAVGSRARAHRRTRWRRPARMRWSPRSAMAPARAFCTTPWPTMPPARRCWRRSRNGGSSPAGKACSGRSPRRRSTTCAGRRPSPLKVARSSAEQSNTSIIYGGRLILKLFRRLEEGPNPDFEIGRYLTEEAAFDRVPRLAGGIEYARTGRHLDARHAAGIGAQPGRRLEVHAGGVEPLLRAGFPIPGARRKTCRRMAGRWWNWRARRFRQSARDKIGIYLDSAATLGRRTGEMHLALGRGDQRSGVRARAVYSGRCPRSSSTGCANTPPACSTP